MINIKTFIFSPFQENTYILYDESKECIIIDPGCFDENERKQLSEYIQKEGLQPVKLINTHGHIDHVFGNRFVATTYDLSPEIHMEDLQMLQMAPQIGQSYGVPTEASPEPTHFLQEGDTITFGNSSLDIFFTPGHSAGSVTLFNKEQKFAIVGDVLFNGSIGRTDLPGGNFNVLINSIKEKLYPLGDDVKVYSGHGPTTTIGEERKNNPFLNN